MRADGSKCLSGEQKGLDRRTSESSAGTESTLPTTVIHLLGRRNMTKSYN